MKRVSVGLPDDLARALSRFQRAQRPRQPLAAILRSAVREFLEKHGVPTIPQITPVGKGSGRRDVSEKHDQYFAGILK